MVGLGWWLEFVIWNIVSNFNDPFVLQGEKQEDWFLAWYFKMWGGVVFSLCLLSTTLLLFKTLLCLEEAVCHRLPLMLLPDEPELRAMEMNPGLLG